MNFEVNKINEVFGGEAYLVTSGNDAVLVDTSYAINIQETIGNIENLLEGRELKHIILTHSHYDHVMGSPAISEHFPEAKIYAHPRIRKIFAKPNARQTRADMIRAAAGARALSAEPGWSNKLHVDIDIRDGDIIDAGDMRIRVVETPGHTHDSISLYFENEYLLIASESIGVPLEFPCVVPGFIVSYSDAIDSIKKTWDIHPKYVLMPHSRVVSEENVDIYFSNALAEAKKIHDIMDEEHSAGKSVEEIVDRLKDIYYKGKFKKFQPDEAFYANWVPLVTKFTENQNR